MAFFDNIQANIGPRAAIPDMNGYRIFDKYINPNDIVYVGIEERDNEIFNTYLEIRSMYKSAICKIADWWADYCDKKVINKTIENGVCKILKFLLWGPGGAESYIAHQSLNKPISIHIAKVISKTDAEYTNMYTVDACSKCSYFEKCIDKKGFTFKKCLSVSACPATGVTRYQRYEDIKKCTICLPGRLAMKCLYEWNWRHGVSDAVWDTSKMKNKPTREKYQMGRFGWWLFDKFYNIYIERISKLK